jgi:hypothetical protein
MRSNYVQPAESATSQIIKLTPRHGHEYDRKKAALCNIELRPFPIRRPGDV